MPTLADIYNLKVQSESSYSHAMQQYDARKSLATATQLYEKGLRDQKALANAGSSGSSGSGGYGGRAGITSVVSAFETTSNEALRSAMSAVNKGYANSENVLNQKAQEASDLIREAYGKAGQVQEKGLADALNSIGIGVDRSREALSKLTGFGESAVDKLSALSGLASGDAQAEALAAMRADPSYMFRLQEGQKAVNQGLAARGVSGGQAAKELSEFGQGLASTEITNVSNRLLNIIGIYSPIAQQQATTEFNAGVTQGQFQQQTAGALAQQEIGAGTSMASIRGALGDALSQLYQDRAMSQAAYLEKLGTSKHMIVQQGNSLSNIGIPAGTGRLL
jgi:hypothetical protein